jgi:hypothetical protein
MNMSPRFTLVNRTSLSSDKLEYAIQSALNILDAYEQEHPGPIQSKPTEPMRILVRPRIGRESQAQLWLLRNVHLELRLSERQQLNSSLPDLINPLLPLLAKWYQAHRKTLLDRHGQEIAMLRI